MKYTAIYTDRVIIGSHSQCITTMTRFELEGGETIEDAMRRVSIPESAEYIFIGWPAMQRLAYRTAPDESPDREHEAMSTDESTDRDCPTCKHDNRADCDAPDYRAMGYDGRLEFWLSAAPCELWEAKV